MSSDRHPSILQAGSLPQSHVLLFLLALPLGVPASVGWSAEGDGFYSIGMSNEMGSIDIDVVDPDTLLPLPADFTSNAAGEYAMSGLIVIEGDTANPIGDVEITGLGDPHLQTKATFVIPVGARAVTGEQFFISFIAGISILASGDSEGGQEVRIETQHDITTTGTGGTPPLSPAVGTSVFMETADNKSTNANAGVSGPYPIPGHLHRSSGLIEFPALPAGTTEDRFSTLVTQVDFAFLDVPADTDFAVDLTSRTDILLPSSGVPGDFNNDGMVNLADYPVWRDNLGAATEDALNGNGNQMGGIDGDDYDYWAMRFGDGSAAVEGASVPEPRSCLLVLAAAVGLLTARGRQRIGCSALTRCSQRSSMELRSKQ